MLTLAVCPHESRKGLEKWKAYANKLSQYFQEEVVVTTFKDFKEEEELLGKLNIHLYYARPQIALALKEQGYLPLAKLKDEKDIFVLLKKKGAELKKPVKVAVISSVLSLMSLLKRFESLIELNFIYCRSFEEVIEELIKDKAQLGVVFKQFWEGVKDKYEGLLEVEEVAKDITLELKLTEELERANFYDLLTGLYNFNGFSFKVQEILSEYDGIGALILVDIRNMSHISHYYGFNVGDKVLKEIARRLREEFRSYDVLARVGGDDFVVFVWKIKSREELTSLVRKLNKIFEKPVKVEGYEIPVSFYAGIAVYPNDGTDFKTLYERASIALKKVKSLGAENVFFFNEELRKVLERQMEAHLLIEKALKKNLFVFFYQPYFSLKEMKLVGLEALVRIIDEEGTVHLPSEFIEFLEKSQYLMDFQHWALEQITKTSRKWGVPIAFNLHPKTLQDKEFMHVLIGKCLREGALITLEITERDLIENIESAKNVLTFVKSSCYGLCVAIDDFGTGYSNFAYLKELPVDYLKIDISFIREVAKSKKDKALVNAIIQMAHSLGIRTIAEGVETKEQLEILKELGCDMAQGYYFAKPMPEQEIEKRLKEWIK